MQQGVKGIANPRNFDRLLRQRLLQAALAK
jgi:hypothetical protein